MLSKKEVRQIAYLARMELSDEETSCYQKELAEIINYIDKLKEVKSTISDLKKDCRNNFREDRTQRKDNKDIKEIFSSSELYHKYIKMPSIFK
jgi:aspartyl/glutamyl-tRNA(Asn/Gln) amidotransferase C subunit